MKLPPIGTHIPYHVLYNVRNWHAQQIERAVRNKDQNQALRHSRIAHRLKEEMS